MFFLKGNKGGEKGRKEVYIIIFKRKGNDLLYRKKGKRFIILEKGNTVEGIMSALEKLSFITDV